MSSGFISGGTTDKPIERDEEWLRAQQEIEDLRRRKEEESRQQDGKSLYEVLQANKAAKQDAFEESIRLKNQFRNLDEDEIEFLDSVLESTRAKEAAIKRETAEQLGLFRQQQEEADRSLIKETTEIDSSNVAGTSGSPSTEAPTWAVNLRKRKRVKEKDTMVGLKLRKNSSPAEHQPFTNDGSTKSESLITPAAKTNPLSHSHTDLMPLHTNMRDSNEPDTSSTTTITCSTPASVVHGLETTERGDSGHPSLGLIDYDSDDGYE